MMNKLFISVLFFLVSCDFSTQLVKKRFSFSAMGTKYWITYYSKKSFDHLQLQKKIISRVEDLENIFSDYRIFSESMRISRKAVQVPLKVSEDFYKVFSLAKKIHHLTEGAFDVSLGYLSRYLRKKEIISIQDFSELQPFIGMKNISISEEKREIFFRKEGIILDFGGIVKGYTNDCIAEIFREHELEFFALQFGGEILLGDVPVDELPWKVALTNYKGEKVKHLFLRNRAISTSGDYFFQKNNSFYSHLLNPKKGSVKKRDYQVTVIAKEGVWADSLATAFAVLGEKKTRKILDGDIINTPLVWVYFL